ncbi:uncharacterized protein METZ01_LOCUS337559 [marine metagenome]|uniref:Uncharacterized protein n=1 Tax=marine metagenome TaxID=408172 RepID=A0A382QIJ0_9ZZZZ
MFELLFAIGLPFAILFLIVIAWPK